MVLPVTLELHADEAPISLVARLSAANGFPSLQNFLAHTDISANSVVSGDRDALSLVSDWSGVSEDVVGRLASSTTGSGLTWRLGEATFNKDMRTGRMLRFCAKCVLDDRETGSGRMVSRPHQRAWWSVRGIEGCHVHDRKLTEAIVAADADHHDFPRYVEAHVGFIQEAASNAIPGSQPQLDRYLVDRVLQPADESFLGRLDAHVAAEFSRYLGDFLVLHDVKDLMADGANSKEWGFRLAEAGEGAIRHVFAKVIERSPPKVRRVETVLGPMVLWLRRNLTKGAYQPLVYLMQDILQRNMPFGPGQTILKPVTIRHLYCVNSASIEFGLTKDRVRVLMEEHYPGFRYDLPDAQTCFDAAVASPILRAASEALTSTEARKVLGIKEERMRDLLDAGIVEQVEMRTGGERAFARIPKPAFDELIRRLTDRMNMTEFDDGLMTLAAAARSWRRPYHNIVGKILDGSLEAFCVPGDEPIFRRVRVKSNALMLDVGCTAGGDDELMRTKEVERVLGTTTATVLELIDRGYLRVRNVRRETGRTVRFVERNSVSEFEKLHISLSGISITRKMHRTLVRAKLEKFRIAPIFEPRGFIARFYKRADLAQANFEI